VKSSAPYEAELFRTDSLTLQGKNQSAAAKLLLVKQFSFSPAPHGFEAACEVTLKFKETLEKPLAVGNRIGHQFSCARRARPLL